MSTMSRRQATRKLSRMNPEFFAVMPFLGPTLRRQVLIELGHGRSTMAELKEHLKVPRSRVAYQIKRLVDRKLVLARGRGQSRSYRLGPMVQVTRQGRRDVLTVAIKGSSISVSNAPGEKPPWK